MFFELAYKNLWRNKRRTILAEISITLGVLVIICTGNFLNGMQRGWAMLEINSNTGAFQVEHRDYKEKGKAEPLKTTLENSAALIDEISVAPGVSGAFGKLKFTGMVSRGLKSTFFDGVAVDVTRLKNTLTRQEDMITSGKPLDETPGGVVLGADLADSLGIKTGDPVTIVVQTFHGGLNLTYGALAGVKNGRHFPSSTYLEMRLDEAQKLLRAPGRVSQIVVRVNDFDKIPDVIDRVTSVISNKGIPFTTRAYPELIQMYATAKASFNFISRIVGLVLLILVGGGVGNVMAMAVMERKSEIGAMRAMGMEKGQVRRLFLTEGLIIGGAGALAGFLVATAWTFVMAAHGGLHLPPPPGTSQDLAIIPLVDPLITVYGIAMPLIVALIASWWPASESAEISPVQAITEV
ncbi:MAG: ABC transporter permease [Nitrospinae bacterium]|nr:ABC transporter permease [Nitrospinota bacterium]